MIRLLIDDGDEVWINPEAVAVVKDIDDKQCSMWTTGQSALENFVINMPGEALVDVIDSAIYGPQEDMEAEEEE